MGAGCRMRNEIAVKREAEIQAKLDKAAADKAAADKAAADKAEESRLAAIVNKLFR